MEITDVRIRKLNTGNRLKGIASITLDNCFVIHDIKIIDSVNGLFIAMPSRPTQNGRHRDVAHPINTETRLWIQKVVLEAFDEAEDPEPMEESHSHKEEEVKEDKKEEKEEDDDEEDDDDDDDDDEDEEDDD